MRTDVLIFGGGVSGLWCLDRFRRSGYRAILLESTALGRGQTIQAQGIIHGGGKYALRGVRDFAAVQASKEMPRRWRLSLGGESQPDLRSARVLSDECYLWLPRGSFTARILSWGLMSVVARAGLLATPPERVGDSVWPEALRGSALAVYSLAEPVIDTGSLLEALAARHQKYIFLCDDPAVRFSQERVEISNAFLQPRSIVFAAGEGNAELLKRASIQGDLMQRRPLGMVLLRGNLPPLFGHCIVGGRTHLTITTPVEGLWQVGGEIAERLAREEDMEAARRLAISEIRRWLPGLDFSGTEVAVYRAIRAEARTAQQRRPSGVHVSRVAARMVVAWPTKLSLAPILAEEVFSLVTMDLKQPGGYDDPAPLPWPTPPVSRYPWEEVEWFPARSAAPGL